ncbi:MAG: DUF1735 domain-containing protein [Prevotella sp.]|nr:DUF1735 domain-containing protein [Prevotella sp.]
MTIKKLYVVAGLALIAGLTFTACSDDNYDVKGNPDDLVFLNKATKKNFEGMIYHTPVGDIGSAQAAFPAQIQRPIDGDVIIGVDPDTSLVSRYNESHGTTYIAPPQEVLYNLEVKMATIKAGEYTTTDSVEVSVKQSDFAKLTEPAYLIPLRLNAKGAVGSQDQGVAYLVVKTGNDFLDFDKTSVTTGVVNTPVGVFGGINAEFVPKTVVSLGVDMSVTLKADMSLVDTYNTEHHTVYTALPNEVVSAVSVESTSIVSTDNAASTPVKVSVPNDKAKSLALGTYLLPMRPLVKVSGKEAMLDKPVYVVVNVTQSLINDNAKEIVGSELPSDAFTCTVADGLDAAAFSTDGWSFNEKKETAGFSLDLGAEHRISGFLIASNVISNYTIEVSADGITWTSLGNSDGHSGPSVSVGWSRYTAYMLYGAMNTRYVKVTIIPDLTYWGWRYIQWGYCSIDKIAFYEE